MIISNIGIKFIKEWEDFISVAYTDSAGIWTIGYGTTQYFNGDKVKEGDTITETEASSYLIERCDNIAFQMTSWIKAILQQHQIDALISFAYNIGSFGFKGSTLLKAINNGQEVIEDYFLRWDKIHKDGQLIEVQGLKNRREAEWLLFSKGIYNVSSSTNN